MSQDHYGDLIERIRHHCQQTAWDAQHLERQQRWLVEPTEDYNGWYIPERQSFIALAQGTDGQEPSSAFPPATLASPMVALDPVTALSESLRVPP